MQKNSVQPTQSPKKVAVLVAQQSLIIHGGIGQFTKAFCDMGQRLGWEVDLVLDGSTSDATKAMVKMMREAGWTGWCWSPVNALSYSMFVETAENRHKDGVNFEKQANFRDSLFRALQSGRDYDMIVCNNPEAFIPVFSMGLTAKIPTVFYTHNENFIGIVDEVGPFSNEYNEVFRRMLSLPNIIIGTQSQHNADRMKRMYNLDAAVLAMPLPELNILKPYMRMADRREGVLFIGRWEDRKDYKTYLRVIKETGLPARVLTNDSGAQKFEAAFIQLGIKNYTIRTKLDGEAKADFIRDSSVYFSPAKKEAFCFAAFECIPHCHVVLLSDYEWSEPFEGLPNVYRVPKKKAAETIKYHHKTMPYRDGIEVLKEYQSKAETDWQLLMLTRPKSTATIPQLRKQETAGVDALFA